MQEQTREMKVLKANINRKKEKLEKLLEATQEDSTLPCNDTINEDTAVLVDEMNKVVQEEPQDLFKRIFREQQVHIYVKLL